MQIDVLDKGYVKLVDSMGTDMSVVRSARVSHGADEVDRTFEDNVKLINYLWKNKHTTPFESATITFEIKAPIFVFRQWHRHRTQSYNEISARYTELPDEFYVPSAAKIGEQSAKNKQARCLPETASSDLALTHRINIADYTRICQIAFEQYKVLLNCGWPRELARMVLPVSTYSRMYTTMNLLNAFKFITLRSDSHAQYEIRVYSDAMLSILETLYPECVRAFKNEQS